MKKGKHNRTKKGDSIIITSFKEDADKKLKSPKKATTTKKVMPKSK